MDRFQDQVVWITGGGTGIGRALALQFHREGAAVAVSGRREDRLAEVVAEIEGDGGRALAVVCDVTDEDAVAAAVARTVDELGRLDVAVANAGFSVVGKVEDLSVADWKRQFDTNLFGLVATARHAIPALRETRGRLVLIGSVAAFLSAAKLGPYNASKYAVRAVGDTLGLELKGSGVSVTTVHPAYVESEIAQVDNEGRHDPSRPDRRPRKLMWRSDDAARAIVRAVHRRRREVVLSGYGKVAASLARHLPGVMPLILGGGRRKRARGGKVGKGSGGGADDGQPQPLAWGDEPFVREVTSPPSTPRQYALALALAPRRAQGSLDGDQLARLRSIEIGQRGVRLDPDGVARYREVCGFDGAGATVPATCPETLFLGLLAEVALSPAFPFSPLGLIHTHQRVVQHRPLRLDEALDLSCRLAEVRRTPRGYELDCALRIDVDGEPVWEGLTLLLSRNEATRARGGRGSSAAATAPPGFTELPVEVPGDTGLRYAAASGDYNPHHLYPITARPLGYRRPIAHGMWTMARALAAAQAEHAVGDALTMEVSFKKPIFMPAETVFRVGADEGGVVPLEVRDPTTGAPHLLGRLQT